MIRDYLYLIVKYVSTVDWTRKKLLLALLCCCFFRASHFRQNHIFFANILLSLQFVKIAIGSANPASASKDVYKYSFFPQTISDWNDLPKSLISSSELSYESVSKFTSLVRARD